MEGLETLTPEQASPWWVREQARRGRIPHLRLGRGRIRFLPEHIDALVRRATVLEHEVEPEPVDLTAPRAPERSHLKPRRGEGRPLF